jgi:primosomal protein N' (replication factor Y) (superfamily II helicase)
LPDAAPAYEAPQRYALVVPDLPAVGRQFTYSVPGQLADRVEIGTQVRVEVQARRVAGWVTELSEDSPEGIAVRPLLAVRGIGPPPSVVDLARWAAWRWAGSFVFGLRTASSDRVVARLADAGSLPPVPPAFGARLPSPEVPAEGATVVRIGPAGDRFGVMRSACDLLWSEDSRADTAGVLILAPTHAQAGEAARRLRGSGYPVAYLPEDWARARAGSCVVVGTMAAAFAPLERLCAAVVLDAHDEGYHAEAAPTWSAWEVVEERTRRDGAPLVLVSPCPTTDLLRGRPLVIRSPETERREWPVVEVVDMGQVDPRLGLFSERLVTLVRWAASDPDGDERVPRRVICVLNRTGRARVVVCSSCNTVARCERCGGALTEQKAKDISGGPHGPLACRRCGFERPFVCAACGSLRLKGLRPGVTKVREELEALAGTAVEEVTGGARAPVGDARVMVGTEAVLHRVEGADAVVFLDFDAELVAPRLRASEEALSLLALSARLVSRSARRPRNVPGGAIVVQTRLADHPAVLAAVRGDPSVLSDPELALRSEMSMPPFSALARITGASADAYGGALRQTAPDGVDVFGPNEGEWNVIAPDHESLCDLLASVPRPSGRLRVEVDPIRA